MPDFPPIEYLFFRDDHTEETWGIVIEFSEIWNREHQSQFKQLKENELSLILPEGIIDGEIGVIDAELERLSTYDIFWFKGIVDNRRPEDYEKADFIEIVGDAYPLEFIVNWNEAIGRPLQCTVCGKTPVYSQPIVAQLVVDESFLDRQIDPAPQYEPPGLDLIHLANGAMLVSNRVIRLFEEERVKGYEKINVVSKDTRKPSQRVFLIRASKAILDPCVTHTSRNEGAICPKCGTIKGGILGYWHVRREWLAGAQIFSRNPLRYASLYIERKIYQLMKNENLKGLLPAYGVFTCTHV